VVRQVHDTSLPPRRHFDRFSRLSQAARSWPTDRQTHAETTLLVRAVRGGAVADPRPRHQPRGTASCLPVDRLLTDSSAVYTATHDRLCDWLRRVNAPRRLYASLHTRDRFNHTICQLVGYAHLTRNKLNVKQALLSASILFQMRGRSCGHLCC